MNTVRQNAKTIIIVILLLSVISLYLTRGNNVKTKYITKEIVKEDKRLIKVNSELIKYSQKSDIIIDSLLSIKKEVKIVYKTISKKVVSTEYIELEGTQCDSVIESYNDCVDMSNELLEVSTKLNYVNDSIILEGKVNATLKDSIIGNLYKRIKLKDDLLALKPKKKRFGIGAFVGMDIKGEPTIAIGLSYNLIRF